MVYLIIKTYAERDFIVKPAQIWAGLLTMELSGVDKEHSSILYSNFLNQGSTLTKNYAPLVFSFFKKIIFCKGTPLIQKITI